MTTQTPTTPRLFNGYTYEQLQAAFNQVANPDDWKDEILATMPGECVNLVVEAIKFFTATNPTVKLNTETMTYIVHSIGYRAGPAGDH